MYKERINAIKAEGKLKLVLVPILMMLLLTILVPGLWAELSNLVFAKPNTLISVKGTIEFILTVVTSVILIMLVAKIKLKDLGLGGTGAFLQSLIGIVAGFLALSLVAIATKIFAGVSITYDFKGEYLPLILVGFVFFAFQGTFEELVYRAYLQPHFSKAFGEVVAILITAVLFTLLHALNPGMTVMPVINLFLASIVFSLVYNNWGSLYLAGFAHGLWNYSQGMIFGSNVSGLQIESTVFKTTPISGASDLISGAAFGLEGSIMTSILGLIIIVLLVIRARKKAI